MLRGRRVAVTGANGGIGRAVCLNMLRESASVIVVCRTIEKSKQLKEYLVQELSEVSRSDFPNSNFSIQCEYADMSQEMDVARVARNIGSPLHVLINMAAECPKNREETDQGLERQFATNVMGYYWMTCACARHLIAGSVDSKTPSRVIHVASYWAGGMDLSDIQTRRRRYDSDEVYRQSKQADRMLAKAFSQKFDNDQVICVSCHPGDVDTHLSRSLGFHGHESPEEGADTPSWLVYTGLGPSESGCYFEHRAERDCQYSRNYNEVQQLWEKCESYSQVIKFSI